MNEMYDMSIGGGGPQIEKDGQSAASSGVYEIPVKAPSQKQQ